MNDNSLVFARIERYTDGLDQAGFEADDKTVDAIVRNLANSWDGFCEIG